MHTEIGIQLIPSRLFKGAAYTLSFLKESTIYTVAFKVHDSSFYHLVYIRLQHCWQVYRKFTCWEKSNNYTRGEGCLVLIRVYCGCLCYFSNEMTFWTLKKCLRDLNLWINMYWKKQRKLDVLGEQTIGWSRAPWVHWRHYHHPKGDKKLCPIRVCKYH